MNPLFQNRFRQKIETREFVISIEINPEKNGDLHKNFQEVALASPFVDVVNVTDSSMARCKPASFAVAARIQKHFDVDTIFNFTCRDRNSIGSKSALLGALILGVKNVLCVTGDPPTKGDMPNAKGVFEFSSTGLLELATKIKCPYGELFCGAVLNFYDDMSGVEKILARKKAAGAKFIISQPVFTEHRIETLKKLQEKFDLPIIAGILPIKKKSIADFMQKNVTGITIPDNDYAEMQNLSDEEIFSKQIKRAKIIFEKAKEIGLAGVHFMPMGRGDKIAEIVGNKLT